MVPSPRNQAPRKYFSHYKNYFSYPTIFIIIWCQLLRTTELRYHLRHLSHSIMHEVDTKSNLTRVHMYLVYELFWQVFVCCIKNKMTAALMQNWTCEVDPTSHRHLITFRLPLHIEAAASLWDCLFMWRPSLCFEAAYSCGGRHFALRLPLHFKAAISLYFFVCCLIVYRLLKCGWGRMFTWLWVTDTNYFVTWIGLFGDQYLWQKYFLTWRKCRLWWEAWWLKYWTWWLKNIIFLNSNPETSQKTCTLNNYY